MNPQDLVNSAISSAMTTVGISIALTIVIVVVSLVFVRRFIGSVTGVDIRGAVSAQATVLKLWDTGTSVNNHPVVGMLLEVLPPDGQPYQTETKSLIPRLAVGQVQPGAVVRVKIDPAKRDRVALDFSGAR